MVLLSWFDPDKSSYENYIRWLASEGIEKILVHLAGGREPVLLDIRTREMNPWGGDFSGLLLVGGGDLNPQLSGAPWARDVNPARDRVEMEYLRRAAERDLPVLGVCRGLQLINVFFGGSLANLEDRGKEALRVHKAPEGDTIHEIRVEVEGLLAELLGNSPRRVNSRHHQVVDRLGQGLRVQAVEESTGVIEALFSPGHRFLLGVQWHPERLRDPSSKRLLGAFLSAIS